MAHHSHDMQCFFEENIGFAGESDDIVMGLRNALERSDERGRGMVSIDVENLLDQPAIRLGDMDIQEIIDSALEVL